jgi:tRNA (guanine-N7-)-methyltransferase
MLSHLKHLDHYAGIETSRQRTIRSFVRREGRITAAQRNALEHLWSKYGVDPAEGRLDLYTLFGRHAPRILEIGFGMGEGLVSLAKGHTENDYLGIEIHRPGVGALLNKLESEHLRNVRIICADAVEILYRHIPDSSLEAIYLFFPDPWPKKRHHKRRLLQSAFVHLVGQKLKVDGVFHMATDWEDYAQHAMEVLSQIPIFVNTAGNGTFSPRPAYRPITKFEHRAHRLGQSVWDLVFVRNELPIQDMQ